MSLWIRGFPVWVTSEHAGVIYTEVRDMRGFNALLVSASSVYKLCAHLRKINVSIFSLFVRLLNVNQINGKTDKFELRLGTFGSQIPC